MAEQTIAAYGNTFSLRLNRLGGCYIWVSRITSGSTSNTLGQITQNFIKEYLDKNLSITNIQVRRVIVHEEKENFYLEYRLKKLCLNLLL